MAGNDMLVQLLTVLISELKESVTSRIDQVLEKIEKHQEENKKLHDTIQTLSTEVDKHTELTELRSQITLTKSPTHFGAPTLPTAAPPRYLITMKSCWEAQLIYSQRLQVLKTEQIYISEDLTPAESRLFYKARQLKKANIIHSTWTKEGQILFRKTYTQDPEELKEGNPLLLTNTNINIDTTTSQTQPIHAPILSKLKKKHRTNRVRLQTD